MGTKCAPTYATTNILMGIFQETHIYPSIKEKVQLYLRYIDDMFLYRQVVKTNYNNFYHNSMRCTPPLKLISTTQKPKYISQTITITKASTGILSTTLYRKEITWQSGINQKSEHPETFKRSIPNSQALRLKKICTINEDFTEKSKVL